jgi:rubredoxin
MERYKCTICGYVYDPQEGDDSGGIEPGILFEDLPVDYICPVCGAGKDEFLKYD